MSSSLEIDTDFKSPERTVGMIMYYCKDLLKESGLAWKREGLR